MEQGQGASRWAGWRGGMLVADVLCGPSVYCVASVPFNQCVMYCGQCTM